MRLQNHKEKPQLSLEEKVMEEKNRKFHSWKKNEITQLLFSKMRQEVEDNMIRVVWNNIENEDIVKGHIQAYQNILNVTLEDLLSE